MLAIPVKNAFKVEVSERDGVGFLSVDLHGEHHDMFKQYCKLPAVLECDGVRYGKSCWNSDWCKAYYRTDVSVAVAVR